ncbi:RNA polymerase II-associated protein 3 [Athalia rosae]|uniref:RNA polymerase II-associated protein 3 n=1 Tax=Athalia rosae TaxID=37344 RepID=UPI0020343569|nr:RNA polymerase II-associated protein 3 [Athalia rosae]
MELDKSILLQKQVRDNASDLQSEYLDMKNWEEQMKRRDAELKYAAGDQVLPPIRSRKNTANKQAVPKIKQIEEKPNRIRSSDYASWEKFDVDKACAQLDEQEERESSDEELPKEELEKNHNEALKHKDKGNIFVKQGKWSQAVECYNEAIKVFPYDAVFYANRALCYLKMDNLYSAEADCTTAIQLDEHYVKAYHRRATARKELKQYKEALQDLEMLLKLDTTNKDATKMLQELERKIEKSKPVVVTQNDLDDDVSIEKKIGEKLWGSPAKPPVLPKKDPIIEKRVPRWELGEGEDVTVVQPIIKAPHQRSKEPLRRIEIQEKKFSKSNTQDTIQDEVELLMNKAPPEKKAKENEVELTKSKPTELPPVPKTTVQFFMQWKKNEDPEFRFNYLKQIPVGVIHEILQDSMEPDIFSEILTILYTEFISRKEPVFRYLEDLAQVKRFGVLTMLMSTSDKNALMGIFKYCKTSENRSSEEIASLQRKYEI